MWNRTLPRVALVVWLSTFALGCGGKRPTERPYRIECDYGVTDPQFQRTMGNLLGPALVEGNSTITLLNGDAIFPAMLDAIRAASETVNFETYIYWDGQVGAAFADALVERAAAGVGVRVMLDWIGGGRVGGKTLRRLRDAGVTLVRYHPLRWYELGWTNKLNNRTHRKLLVVDGRVGFTGGVGIADEWA